MQLVQIEYCDRSNGTSHHRTANAMLLEDGSALTEHGEVVQANDFEWFAYDVPVAAAPGWYALYLVVFDDEHRVERWPVVSWLASAGAWGAPPGSSLSQRTTRGTGQWTPTPGPPVA